MAPRPVDPAGAHVGVYTQVWIDEQTWKASVFSTGQGAADMLGGLIAIRFNKEQT